jgi:hypothetical protein
MSSHLMLNRPRERGITLLIVLIMLLVITLVSITSFKLSNANLQVVNNMQLRNQTKEAAQAAIEATVSTPVFTTVPNIPVTTTVSVGGSGGSDIQVVTTPTCVAIQPIPNSALNLSNPDDIGCVSGVGQQNGIVGTNGPNSMCSNSVWNIEAVATDLSTNAKSTINQGEAVRVSSSASCP